MAQTKAEPEPPPPVSTHGAILVVSDHAEAGGFHRGPGWRGARARASPIPASPSFGDGTPARRCTARRSASLWKAGRPLPAGLVVRQGEPGFLAAILKPGLRAVSVPTGVVESSFGLVSSGDVVDVILALKRSETPTRRSEGAGRDAPYLAAQTILHGVRVLALNNQVRGDSPVRPDKHRPEGGR